MKIAVIGVGYVGLTTAAFLAETGNQVVGCDISKKKIRQLKMGKIPFFEPGLKKIVCENSDSGRLIFTIDLKKALKDCCVAMVCVGTPPLFNGDVDLAAVKKACEAIVKQAGGPILLVVKSTVPPYIEEVLEDTLKRGRYPVELATCPEFLREGSAVWDIFHSDRVVIGSNSTKAARILTTLHRSLNVPIIVCNIRSAQLIKYASNAFLALKISFANEIANICDGVGADAGTVLKGVGLDRRIGPKFLRPGIGYGGSCFPKDTKGLIHIAKEHDRQICTVSAAVEVNAKQVMVVMEKIKALVGRLRGKKIGILGLSFKPETDDIREAPSLLLIAQLLKEGARVVAYDPVVRESMLNSLGINIIFANGVDGVARKASCIVLVTEWKQFCELDWTHLRGLVRHPNVVDARNLWDSSVVRAADFRYLGIGKQ